MTFEKALIDFIHSIIDFSMALKSGEVFLDTKFSQYITQSKEASLYLLLILISNTIKISAKNIKQEQRFSINLHYFSVKEHCQNSGSLVYMFLIVRCKKLGYLIHLATFELFIAFPKNIRRNVCYKTNYFSYIFEKYSLLL